MTQELHIIRAHLLYFTSLLIDLKKTVNFVLETPNPSFQSSNRDNLEVGDSADHPEELDTRKKFSEKLMKRECETLLAQVDRLEAKRSMMLLRLRNVMRLVGCFLF